MLRFHLDRLGQFRRVMTYSETGFRWKGQSRGVFSICWTEAEGRPGEDGGSLQAALLQEPLWPPQCEPPLDGGLEAVEREGPWACWAPSPPPGFGAFCIALKDKKYTLELIQV